MPYITQERREDLKSVGCRCYDHERTIDGGGELNYLFTELIIEYLTTHGLNYKHINNVLGALEGCKLEFYNRVAVPYESRKINENGDVYPRELLSLPPEPRPIDPKRVGNVYESWEMQDDMPAWIEPMPADPSTIEHLPYVPGRLVREYN